MVNLPPDAFWPWFRVGSPGFHPATDNALPDDSNAVLPSSGAWMSTGIGPDGSMRPFGAAGFNVRPETPVPGFNFVAPIDDSPGFRVATDGSTQNSPPDRFGLAAFGYGPQASMAPRTRIASDLASRPVEEDPIYAAISPDLYRPPDRIRDALDQITRIYAGFGHDQLDRPGDINPESIVPLNIRPNRGESPSGDNGFNSPYAIPVNYRPAEGVGDEERSSSPVDPASPPQAQPQAPQQVLTASPRSSVANTAAAVGGGSISLPYAPPIAQGALGSLAGDAATLGARALQAIAGGGSAAAAAMPILIVPTNTQSDIVDLGEGLRARLNPGQRSVEIERRVDGGLFGTGFGARWEKLPVNAEQGAGADGGRSVFIDHRQLADAVGPEATARARDAISSAMARPPEKSADSQPPTEKNRKTDERPDPENDGKPPPGEVPTAPPQRQRPTEVSEVERDRARFATRQGLQRDSATTRQILENLDMPFETFVGQYRQGRILHALPEEIRRGTVRQALESGNRTARKLLTDRRFHR